MNLVGYKGDEPQVIQWDSAHPNPYFPVSYLSGAVNNSNPPVTII